MCDRWVQWTWRIWPPLTLLGRRIASAEPPASQSTERSERCCIPGRPLRSVCPGLPRPWWTRARPPPARPHRCPPCHPHPPPSGARAWGPPRPAQPGLWWQTGSLGCDRPLPPPSLRDYGAPLPPTPPPLPPGPPVHLSVQHRSGNLGQSGLVGSQSKNSVFQFNAWQAKLWWHRHPTDKKYGFCSESGRSFVAREKVRIFPYSRPPPPTSGFSCALCLPPTPVACDAPRHLLSGTGPSRSPRSRPPPPPCWRWTPSWPCCRSGTARDIAKGDAVYPVVGGLPTDSGGTLLRPELLVFSPQNAPPTQCASDTPGFFAEMALVDVCLQAGKHHCRGRTLPGLRDVAGTWGQALFFFGL